MYVNWSAGEGELVPPGVVTRMWTVPVPAGEVAVIWEGESTVNPAAAVLPKVTAIAPVNPVPVMTTDVDPPTEPEAGEMPETVGAIAYVNRSSDDVALGPPVVVTTTSTAPAA